MLRVPSRLVWQGDDVDDCLGSKNKAGRTAARNDITDAMSRKLREFSSGVVGMSSPPDANVNDVTSGLDSVANVEVGSIDANFITAGNDLALSSVTPNKAGPTAPPPLPLLPNNAPNMQP